MKNMFFFLTAFLTLPVLAESLTDKIHSVVPASSKNYIVLFKQGRVGFVSDPALVGIMKESVGAEVRVELDNRNDIRTMSVLSAPSNYDIYMKNNISVEPPAFEPSIVTMETVNEIFKSMDPNFKRLSECSDRAHVWASDAYQKFGIKFQKAFIFFTASYINRVRFKWWFHVAPMFTLENGEKMVNDKMFKDRPVTVKDWKDMMVFSGRDCKMTTKFSEYDVNPQTEDCYMIYESMYYRIPMDIQNQELRGTYRTEWNDFEVNSARSRSFNIGRIQ